MSWEVVGILWKPSDPSLCVKSIKDLISLSQERMQKHWEYLVGPLKAASHVEQKEGRIGIACSVAVRASFEGEGERE